MKERDYLYTTPPRDTRRRSPPYSFPTIKVLAYNINNVFPYGINVNCCLPPNVARKIAIIIIHVLKPTHYEERKRGYPRPIEERSKEN